MQLSVIGRQLRARRTAAGRTVASVAADAALSVPYIANLENGRGNPTIAALQRVAQALDLRMSISLEAAPAAAGEPSGRTDADDAAAPSIPSSLVRLGRTRHFKRTAAGCAAALDTDADEFTERLVSALASVARALDRELEEADWWRLLDAVLLVAVDPT